MCGHLEELKRLPGMVWVVVVVAAAASFKDGQVRYGDIVNKGTAPVVWKKATCLTRLCWRCNKQVGGCGGMLRSSDSANKTERCAIVSVLFHWCVCRLWLPLPPPDKTQLISRDALDAALERTLFRQRREFRHTRWVEVHRQAATPPAPAAIFQTISIFCCCVCETLKCLHHTAGVYYTVGTTLFWYTPVCLSVQHIWGCCKTKQNSKQART